MEAGSGISFIKILEASSAVSPILLPRMVNPTEKSFVSIASKSDKFSIKLRNCLNMLRRAPAEEEKASYRVVSSLSAIIYYMMLLLLSFMPAVDT